MMKWGFAIHALIGGVLVVPTVTLASGAGKDLETSLRDTVQALERLSGIEKRVQAREETAFELVRQATEPSVDDAQRANKLLQELRAEVGRLHMTQDSSAMLRDRPVNEASSHVGLSEAQRRKISGQHDPLTMSETHGPRAVRPLKSVPANPKAVSLEHDGFSADPMRHGQAYYRAGRYADCIDVLFTLGSDPLARYWTARATEGLGRADDALKIYDEVVKGAADAELIRRAKVDADYLRWKKSFAEKLAETKKANV